MIFNSQCGVEILLTCSLMDVKFEEVDWLRLCNALAWPCIEVGCITTLKQFSPEIMGFRIATANPVCPKVKGLQRVSN